MSQTLRNILEQYRNKSLFNRDLGDHFERLVRGYFKLEPRYQGLFEDVWLWKDWPQREALGYKAQDTGIDLVAKFRDQEGFCAIQCKFYGIDSQVPKNELGTFFTLSGRVDFTQRFIVTTGKLPRHMVEALPKQRIPVQLITLQDLEDSAIDWDKFSLERPEQLYKKAGKSPRPHQERARADVIKGFGANERGKLIMACGTGKTYTSLIIAEQMVKAGQNVLFLVPSISLMSQSLRAWTEDASVPLRCFAVCSDSKVSRRDEDTRIYELAYPATTDAQKLAEHFNQTRNDNAMTVVFATYQSIEVVHQAQQKLGMVFDLVICDEAHRTTGYTPSGEDHSAFVRIHDNNYIRAHKRLYMTATPRIYAEDSKKRAQENAVEVFSMDDKATFGPEFHRLRFDEAVRQNLLSDYKVLVIAVDELHVDSVLKRRLANQNDELNLDDAVKIVGCWNALGKHAAAEDGMDFSGDAQPMRTAIAFAQSIKHSRHLAEEFQKISGELGNRIEYLPALEAQHVDGTMNVQARNEKLAWLEDNIGKQAPLCRILTNARCLCEGVDVPALDAAIFLNPRDSVVDVVQSVGRVMRKDKAGRKQYGYVILPIGVRRDASPEAALNNNDKYKVVWQVLNALRAHDDRLENQFAKMDLTGKANGVVNIIGVGGGNDQGDSFGGEQQGLEFDPEELGKWQDAIYAKIVSKCGNRRYWEDWAKDIAQIAERHKARIGKILERPYSQGKKAFDQFLRGVRKNLNPSISQDDAIEMLAQHIITKPVFEALFEGSDFTRQNPVSQAMQKIMEILEAQALDKDHDTLQGFYDSVRQRASGITDPAGRQRIILELYDKFFKNAFPRMVERLGIVYTPVELVDFILHSADAALQEHFDSRLADNHVHILDPFTGTGTFPVRLIEAGLIPREQLPYKYRHEIHANEIVLLAYYIAAINIETAYHQLTGQAYEAFPGIVLTDTFQLNEPVTGELDTGLPENHQRADRQKAQDIRVIVGNPPYSVGQGNGNDNNQNLKYPNLDSRIAATYAANTSATNKNNLYDSYIRAFRWASDRIKDEGIVCFVTNGGWIDSKTGAGFRASLENEFADIYVFNLRGEAGPGIPKAEGGPIFGSSCALTIAITLLVKRRAHQGKALIHYHDIGDYLTREQKLQILSDFKSYRNIPWQTLEPNPYHDWINQRSEEFNTLAPLNDGPDAIFAMRSNGVKTNRDAWVYNSGKEALEGNVQRMIDFYNGQVALYGERCKAAGKDGYRMAMELADANPRKIKWNRGLYKDLGRSKPCEFELEDVRLALYRPFCKQWVYFSRRLNDCVYQQHKLYPTVAHGNLTIQVTGTGEDNDFSCLISNVIPNFHTISGGPCYPLYWYEQATDASSQVGLGLGGEGAGEVDANGYIRRDGVTDGALDKFRQHYGDEGISKEAIFYYVYGVLHSPQYRQQYRTDLKKVLPRIPHAPDFWAFSQAGRRLAQLHLNYEQAEPWPVVVEAKDRGDLDDLAYYRVEKMRFKNKDKSVIVYNSRITLRDIPLGAYDYVVNGRSAIEWVMGRYQDRIDTGKRGKGSYIRNDANDWCREHHQPSYVLDLLRRVIRVSVETVEIVKGLPAIE